MRQLNLIEPGRLEWREAFEPRLERDGNATLRPVAVATCGLDLLLVRGLAPAAGRWLLRLGAGRRAAAPDRRRLADRPDNRIELSLRTVRSLEVPV